jgi:hypothetical protein
MTLQPLIEYKICEECKTKFSGRNSRQHLCFSCLSKKDLLRFDEDGRLTNVRGDDIYENAS